MLYFQDSTPENYCLIEVLLDKGVSEKILEKNDKPWQLIQQSRTVSIFAKYMLPNSLAYKGICENIGIILFVILCIV